MFNVFGFGAVGNGVADDTAIRVFGQSRDNLITGNILGAATEKLLDANGDPSEIRDNLLLRQGV